MEIFKDCINYKTCSNIKESRSEREVVINFTGEKAERAIKLLEDLFNE